MPQSKPIPIPQHPNLTLFCWQHKMLVASLQLVLMTVVDAAPHRTARYNTDVVAAIRSSVRLSVFYPHFKWILTETYHNHFCQQNKKSIHKNCTPYSTTLHTTAATTDDCRLQSTEQLLLLFLRKRSCINFQDRGKSNQPEWTKEPLQEQQQKQQWHQQDIATNLKKKKKLVAAIVVGCRHTYTYWLVPSSTRAPLNNTNTYHVNWAGYSEEQQWAIKSVYIQGYIML